MVWEKVFNHKKTRIKVNLISIPEIPVPVYTRKCEVCGGDPTCVKYCEVGALTYLEDNPKPDKKYYYTRNSCRRVVKTGYGE